MEFAEGEKDKLVKKFNKLRTIEEKFDFWLNELKRPYFMWATTSQQEIKEFMILPKNENETVEINKRCIEVYKDRRDRISTVKRVLILEEIKSVFLERYHSAKDKEKLIEVEKQNLERKKEENKKSWLAEYVYQERYFNTAFNDFYIDRIEPDLSSRVYEMEDLIAMNNGFVIAEYSLFLDDLLKNKAPRTKELTHIEQMLILDYLGIGKNTQNSNKKADLYAPLIRRDWETTRQNFSTLYSKKKEKNLKTILDFFEKAGCSNQVEQVKKDIDKLIKKK